MENQRGKLKETLFFCVNIIVSLLFLFFVYRLWERDFYTPIVYNGGDGVGALITIRKAIEGKGFFDFDFFSAPYGRQLYSQDYFLPYLIVKFVTIFTSDVGVAANLFWISTYILTAAAMYIFLKKLGCSWATIVVGSTLYNFLPYHHLRLEHFWLMGCYIVPLVGYMVLDILEEQSKEINGRKKHIKCFVCFVFALLIGLNGLYYAVFSIMVLTIAVFYSMVYKRRYKAIKRYLIDCIGIVLPVIALYAIPMAVFGTSEMSNIAADRNISQINTFGLNLILMFLPIPGHRLQIFSDFTQYCYDQMYVYTENFMVSLGMVMAAGVTIAVLFAFKKSCDGKWEERIRDFGILILIIFIVATTGGLDNFIAIFVSASIRCYNRLSIFIALFAMAAVCLLLDQAGVFFKKQKKYSVFFGICSVITIIGVLDVTSPNFAKYETYDIGKKEYVYAYSAIKEEYTNDVAFFEKINAELDEEKMLFIAPYKENVSKYGEKGYFSRLKTYVLQPEIRTSFSFFDEKYEKWWERVSESEIETQMKLLSILGYSGILLDENGFSGKQEMNEYIESIAEYVDENSRITSDNDNLYFYSMKEFKQEFVSQYSNEELEKWREDIYINIYGEYSSVNMDELHGLDENNIVKAGTVQFGPYYSLEAGDYQIVLYGKGLSEVQVKVTAASGTEEIPVKNLRVSQDSIQYEITIDKKCDEVEFVAESTRDFEIYRYYYAEKVDDDFDLWNLLRIKKALSEEFGLGGYKKELSLDEFKIKGEGKIRKDGIFLYSASTQYGPYLYLEQGNYRIQVKGEGLRNADYWVTAETGKTTIKSNLVEQSDTILVYEFALYESMNGIEFLIESENDKVYIEEYILSFEGN